MLKKTPSFLSILGAVFAAQSIFSVILNLFEVGLSDNYNVLASFYRELTIFLFAWIEPLLSKLGTLPFWWRDGLVMLLLIAAQWMQAVSNGKASWLEAAEFIAIGLLTGVGTYVIDVAQDGLQIAFFGVAGAFIGLLTQGVFSFFKPDIDGEAWVGRYLLRSIGMLALFTLINAGFVLSGA